MSAGLIVTFRNVTSQGRGRRRIDIQCGSRPLDREVFEDDIAIGCRMPATQEPGIIELERAFNERRVTIELGAFHRVKTTRK